MQRQSLVPLRAFMQRKGSVDGSGMKLLEVACGTGRFATFVKVWTILLWKINLGPCMAKIT